MTRVNSICSLPAELTEMIYEFSDTGTLCSLVKVSKATFHSAKRVLWRSIPTGQALINLVYCEEGTGRWPSTIQRFRLYASDVREVDVGLLSFNYFQYQGLLEAAASDQEGPLFPNLERILMHPENPPHPYVLLDDERSLNLRNGFFSKREPNWAHSGFFALLALGPRLHTLHYAYSWGNYPDFELITRLRAPNLQTLGLFRIEEPEVISPRFDEVIIPYRGHEEAHKKLGFYGELLVFLANPRDLNLLWNIHSLTLTGQVVHSIHLPDLGLLPTLHTLVFQRCLTSDSTTVWSPTAVPNAFSALRCLKFTETDSHMVSCICAVTGILRMVESVHWSSIAQLDGEDTSVGVLLNEEEFYTNVVELLYEQAPRLQSLKIFLPGADLLPEFSTKLGELAASIRPGLVGKVVTVSSHLTLLG